MPDLYPLRFEPIYKDYMWGGQRFASVLGRPLDAEGVYAESWEIADHPEGMSVVAAGPLAGSTLAQLRQEHGPSLFGRHHPQPQFPLLLKYLDANRHLSLQVHPDDRCAAAMGLTDPGKTEAWYILDAEPGSCMWAGFAESADRAAVEDALRQGDVERLLHRVEPQPGDCIFVPAGTVHALGAGLMVAEIQQMSDNTFRLSDWGRLGTDGKPRQLHVDEGLQAIDYDRGPVEPTQGQPAGDPSVRRLVECEQFVLDCHTLNGETLIDGDDRCVIMTAVAGQIDVAGDVAPPLRRGQTILLPASAGPTRLAAVDGTATVLTAFVP